MNEHNGVETLAFALSAIARLWAQRVGCEDDEPIFIFGAGLHSGYSELRVRLQGIVHIDEERSLDGLTIDMLARQLVRVAACTPDDDIQCGSEPAPTPAPQAISVPNIVAAQLDFLYALGFKHAGCQSWGRAFTALTGDYALYLKLLYPRAKFVFLHRNPLETFQNCLQSLTKSICSTGHDPAWAASFAEQWYQLVASFALWHNEVNGIMINFDHIFTSGAAAIDEYLGYSIPSQVQEDRPRRTTGNGHIELAPRDVRIIVDRAGEIAERYGHHLAHPGQSEKGVRSAGVTHPAENLPPDPLNRNRCAVLVPTLRYIEPECEESLRELERRGYCVKRLHGCSAIDSARNKLATDAMEQGFGETIWVDADVAFDPDDVDRLRSHDLPIVTGIYAKKGKRELAVAAIPGTKSIVLGKNGGLVEILYAATGFLLVRRCVYEAIQRRFELPICSPNAPHRAIPFFMPMLEHWDGEMSYLAEDYAFSRRARLCGFKVIADTTVRLWHVGTYGYGFEDAGNRIERVDTYEHFFAPPVWR